MKSTLFRETNILLGYVKTLLVYTCVVIADKFYCRQQYFNMTSDRAGKTEWQSNDKNNLQIIWELNPILHSFVKYTPYKSQGCGCGQAAQGWEKDRKDTVRLQNWRHRNFRQARKQNARVRWADWHVQHAKWLNARPHCKSWMRNTGRLSAIYPFYSSVYKLRNLGLLKMTSNSPRMH